MKSVPYSGTHQLFPFVFYLSTGKKEPPTGRFFLFVEKPGCAIQEATGFLAYSE